MLPITSVFIADEEEKAIMNHNHGRLHRLKAKGWIPRGSESVFGDFPAEYALPANHRREEHPNALDASGVEVHRSNKPVMTRTVQEETQFRRSYNRGELPVYVDQSGAVQHIGWRIDKAAIDMVHYLPLFCDGLREQEDPYRLLAIDGSLEMIRSCFGTNKLVSVIPHLILPLKRAFNTHSPKVVVTVCLVIQELLSTHRLVGKALLPYFRQLLPVMGLFIQRNKNLGDQFDFSQRKGLCLGDVILETLRLLEASTGKQGLINIKYVIPTYESAL